ncbi:hypothetical protein BDB01DRAFT_855409 [Pilobolus umbonatus]|nr:hypothetical protein BDB01DRAFT_855409 [Pilobolus umbonatus]
MELVSQYYERPKKYKRKFTPTKPKSEEITSQAEFKLVLSLGDPRFTICLMIRYLIYKPVGVGFTSDLSLERPFPHMPIRANKRRFKPSVPTRKRSRAKVVQASNSGTLPPGS